MKTSTLDPASIARLLGRTQRLEPAPDEVHVDEFFEQILRIADRFVPSEAGSVLIDDPTLKVDNAWNPSLNELVFVACYGERAESLVGQRLPADSGIAGRTYLTGQPCIIAEAGRDPRLAEMPSVSDFEARSLISVPIQIGRATCGVLELLNRRSGDSYEDSDLELLLIFAGYISTSLQNVLDANRYKELSKRDDLSGLYNDRYFNHALSEQIELAEETGADLSLIFLDLDRFKEVNDKHGHLVGSQTLREVGLILGGGVTPEGSIVARYGGDEFVIIVPDSSLEDGVELAETIREKIANTVFRIDHDTEASGTLMIAGVVTASIGVSSYRSLGFGPDDKLISRKNALIRGADQSMYRAKSEGKNRVCFGVNEPGAKAGIASSQAKG